MREMRRVPRNKAGFSLLEVLIALSIFSIGMLAVAKMQIMAIQGNEFSMRTFDASTLAHDRLEQLMGLTYTTTSTAAGLAADTYSENQTRQGITYTVTWTIQNDVIATNTKSIDVAVTWTERNRSRSLSVQGVRAIEAG